VRTEKKENADRRGEEEEDCQRGSRTVRRVNGTMPRLIVPARPGRGLSMLELLNNTGGTSARGADERRPCGTRTGNRSKVRRAGMPRRKCKETETLRRKFRRGSGRKRLVERAEGDAVKRAWSHKTVQCRSGQGRQAGGRWSINF
jgi:hypothetical protein